MNELREDFPQHALETPSSFAKNFLMILTEGKYAIQDLNKVTGLPQIKKIFENEKLCNELQ